MSTPEVRTEKTDALSFALKYAERGWAVFPLHSPDPSVPGGCSCRKRACSTPAKHPRTPNGLSDATTDVEVITRWWTRWPKANVAVVTGSRSGGLVVLDVDAKKDGPEQVKQLPQSLPETPISMTGGGGFHVFFVSHQKLQNSVELVGPGLDIRADGGYVVAPPSVHVSGREYVWEASSHIDDIAIAELPQWLIDLASRKRTKRVVAGEGVQVIQGGRNDALFLLGCSVRRKGVSEEAIRAMLLAENQAMCRPPLDEAEVAKIAHSVSRYDGSEPYYDGAGSVPAGSVPASAPVAKIERDWIQSLYRKPPDKRGERDPVACVANAVIILQRDPEWTGVISWDEFSMGVRTTRRPPWYPEDMPANHGEPGAWNDEDDTRVANWLTRAYSLKLSSVQCREAVHVVAKANAVHPVREYLKSLSWDGVPRLRSWLSDYFGVPDSEYAQCVGRWWMIAAVARIFKPGCKVDNVLILEGLTGTFKSTAIATLLPQREWLNDTPFTIGDKDGFLSLVGRWIVELAELDSLTRSDPARSKAFFSSGVDAYRPPYGRSIVQVPRQSVFIGTVNPSGSGYLVDDTGNRRFWPVTCGSLDLPGLSAMRDQLWAEAAAAYHDGAQWWPVAGTSVAKELTAQQDERYRSDAWEDVILEWLESSDGKGRLSRNGYITQADILGSALGLEKAKWSKPEQTRVGICMNRLGWQKSRPRIRGILSRVFTPPGSAPDPT